MLNTIKEPEMSQFLFWLKWKIALKNGTKASLIPDNLELWEQQNNNVVTNIVLTSLYKFTMFTMSCA